MSSVKYLIAICLAVLMLSLPACGYNRLQRADEATSANWSEVLNQYQRRADLIPNLVATVQGYAAHEQSTLVAVTNARAQVANLSATPALLNDPQALTRFDAAQTQLTSALSKLMVVVESYPELKADQGFRDLQTQLEGTENRITVARKRYIDAVQEYNVTVRSFPGNVLARMFGFQTKANFSVEDPQALAKPPTVNFSAPGSAP